MSWTYVIESGRFYRRSRFFATGWSGHSAGKNNPAMVSVHGVGPIPPGRYTIGDPKEPPDHLGPLAMPLTPHPSNNMHGRGGFFIHGANPAHPELSSDGCLIFGYDDRRVIADDDDTDLIVVIHDPFAVKPPPTSPAAPAVRVKETA